MAAVPSCPPARRSRVLLPATLLWVVTYLLALWVLRHGALAEPSLRFALALAPVAPFVFFLVTLVRHVTTLDELARRVHLEALAIAFPLAMALLMALGLVEIAVGLPRDDWSYRHTWTFLPLFYAVGLAVAWRRYT